MTAQHSREKRTCWWCQDGSNPLTREHVIGQWLPEYLHGEGVLHHAHTAPGESAPELSWDSQRADFKAKVVCKRCNNEWMSELEVAAKAVLPPFLRAKHGRRLNFKNAPVLARWATKTALMFPAMGPTAERVFPSDCYTEFAGGDDIPARIRVWIGSVRAHGVWSTSFAGEIRSAPRPVPYASALLAIDTVAFFIMWAEDADVLSRLSLGVLANAWIPITPLVRARDWPPPYVFPAEQFSAMPSLLAATARLPEAA